MGRGTAAQGPGYAVWLTSTTHVPHPLFSIVLRFIGALPTQSASGCVSHHCCSCTTLTDDVVWLRKLIGSNSCLMDNVKHAAFELLPESGLQTPGLVECRAPGL